MVTHIISHRQLVRLTGATAAVFLLSANASAQQFETKGPFPEDPVLQLAQQSAPRNEFYIDSNQNVEIVRFQTPRDLEICASRGPGGLDRADRGYALKVTWDSQTAVIAPGNCLAFDATRVAVSAASLLPQDVVLKGSFRVSK